MLFWFFILLLSPCNSSSLESRQYRAVIFSIAILMLLFCMVCIYYAVPYIREIGETVCFFQRCERILIQVRPLISFSWGHENDPVRFLLPKLWFRFAVQFHFEFETLVAMCVAMRLPPWLSRELIKAAGFGLSETERQRTCMMILDHLYTASIDEVQAILSSYGEDALKLTA